MTNQLPLTINKDDQSTLQNQLFNEIRRLILNGGLKPGIAMPATRELATQLNVSRNTTLLAYERLIAEGYLETKPAVGTFVTSHIPEASLLLDACPEQHKKQDISQQSRCLPRFSGTPHTVYKPKSEEIDIDFKVGRPDPRSFPVSRWRQLTIRQLQLAHDNLTEYNDPSGIFRLRKAIVDHLGPARGISVSPEQVLIVAGCQEALNIIARLFITEETEVVIECPAYQGAANVFESYGAKLNPIAVDIEGLTTAHLPKGEIKLAYLTPSHQYPLGYTLSLKRRLELLEWANQTGAYLIEDDYDSDFRHHGSPLTALKGLDHNDSVIYLGTFSKSIGASLRMGYMVLPEALIEPARTVKTLLNNGQPWLEQAVVAEFIRSGGFANHLRRIRHTYLNRRDCLIKTLQEQFEDVELTGLEGGMHLTWKLPDHFPAATKLESIAAHVGVGIYSLPKGDAYCSGNKEQHERMLMLGYSSLTEQQIKEGIIRIARALEKTEHPTALTQKHYLELA
ncbi:MocR-like pyridoxine biosynthesis transcription factor PdxR [Sedimenticola selenatireducens]|uniref:PLP-dependent aminotransferase family protein n=1 Tax=Sedimenticola selenatireducens TaxID=191960 RepID=A0A558DX54_9GAMM|nr:PLP-dependent aminotransferase family protein [Sedimenticola selenatireducens]TVO70741.1 PLP-dependent aminotransferase family protein [Sedimenticola selenatireducens]TVT65661.1 MAG: PLP-dependent aminotransferase family protein [Sedimenticola selenatireducens]